MNAPRPASPPFLRLLILAVGCGGVVASVQAEPVVSNLTATQRAGTKLVDITYDLAALGFGAVSVTLEASSDGGATWTVPVTSATGAFGAGVTLGTGIAMDLQTRRVSVRGKGGRPPWNASKTEPSERRNLDQFGRLRDRGKLFLPKIGEKPPGNDELPYPQMKPQRSQVLQSIRKVSRNPSAIPCATVPRSFAPIVLQPPSICREVVLMTLPEGTGPGGSLHPRSSAISVGPDRTNSLRDWPFRSGLRSQARNPLRPAPSRHSERVFERNSEIA